MNESDLGTATLIAALATQGLDIKTAGASQHILVPTGYTLKEITEAVEKAGPTPQRKRGHALLGSVDSLVTYAKDQAASNAGYIYADTDARTITAVFNDHRDSATPGWRDHRATFKAVYTPEFDNWLRNNRQPKEQAAFAEFIEDNFADLQGDEARTLLEVATTLQASTGINFRSSKRLQDGQNQILYNETIDTKAGADGQLKVPQTFALGLRIFKGDAAGYKFTARLKFRLSGSSCKFWYELERPERAIEDAFAGYIAKVGEASGYTILHGAA